MIRPLILLAAVLSGCATTNFQTSGAVPTAPLCDANATALVLWGPAWRSNQKDVLQREAAAQQGIESFFAHSGCYQRATVQRVMGTPQAPSASMDFKSMAHDAGRIVVIIVRELGPIVRVFDSPALVDGAPKSS